MKHTRLLLPLLALVLLGQGCPGSRPAAEADGGVWRTDNAGDAWMRAAAVPSAAGVGTLADANVLALATDPQDPDTMYLGTRASGLFYSLNAGASWQRPRDAELRTGAVASVAPDPKDVCTIYVAKGTRLYKSEDCLRSFDSQTYVETRSNVSIRQVLVDWFNPSVVWLGLSNGDVVKSDDAGGSWRTVLSTKADTIGMMLNRADSRILLVATDASGLYKTTDGGANWTQINDELRAFRNANRILSISQTADSSVVLATSRYGILRSRDFGSSWDALELLTAPGQVTIKAAAMDPDDGDTIYYAALSTFYRSQNGGADWATRELPTGRESQVIHVDPRNPAVVYLGVAEIPK